jgi:hypothetical protein
MAYSFVTLKTPLPGQSHYIACRLLCAAELPSIVRWRENVVLEKMALTYEDGRNWNISLKKSFWKHFGCTTCKDRLTFRSALAWIGGNIQTMRPPLWSSGRSSWPQIRRTGFDSRHYQGKKVVGLERGPLSLVSTTEELLDRKVVAPV